MNARTLLIQAPLLALLLAGCATSGRDAPDVVQARATVQRVDRDPLARQVAAVQLDAAQTSLQAAEHQSGAERDQSLFEANRNAEIAEAMVRTARARAQVDATAKERAQVLLQARERETAEARTAAQASAAQAAAATSQAAAAASEAEQLRQQLAALHAQQTERGMVLTLPDVLFDTGRAVLNPGANGPLEQVAMFLKGNAHFKARIEGHTDSVGAAAYNQTLSEQRANSVRDALLGRGVAAEQLSALGKGESTPVASNATAAGRQQNRRVEIVFSDSQGQFAGGGSPPSSGSTP